VGRECRHVAGLALDLQRDRLRRLAQLRQIVRRRVLFANQIGIEGYAVQAAETAERPQPAILRKSGIFRGQIFRAVSRPRTAEWDYGHP
jgi:hypothetical protein